MARSTLTIASPPFDILELKPGDADLISAHPSDERTFRDIVESWLLIDHDTNGLHNKVQLPERADPTLVANVGILYSKDVGGVSELHYIDSAGTVKQVTSAGKLLIVASEISNNLITLAMIAGKADSNAGLLGYDGSGNPVEIQEGATGEVLTSAGAGTPSSFSALPANNFVQLVNVQDGAVATGTTVTVDDDTIPQNTEGDEYMTLAITPDNTNNILIIEVVVNLAHSAESNNPAQVALFQDATANALAAVHGFVDGSNFMETFSFIHKMTAGTASATTFKVRAGLSTAGTTTFNGASGARKLGGVLASSITIREYLP